MSAHALLGASSSARWIRCPPSARLAAQFPDTGSAYAAAGTLAHAIGELKARKYFLEPMSAQEYGARLKKLKADPSYAKDMDAATDAYLDCLKELAMGFGEARPFVALECRVDYSHYAPEGFGTADCIMLGGGRLCVCDYKNGAGVAVEAERNSQLMLYALGALRRFDPIYGESIQDIHLAIVQPHAGGVKTWGLSRRELEDWGETVVRPAAALAYRGEGAFCPGPWCDKGFCPARAQCAARAKELLALGGASAATGPADCPSTLPDEEIGAVLARGRELAAWIKDLEDYALNACLAGRTIDGFKAVEGRGSREWDPGADEAFTQLLLRGVEEAVLWERRPVTPPALEKALGKKQFAQAAAGLVKKKPGKPTLVPESDPRPAYCAPAVAFQKIND